jgi:hypothetical protein
MIVGVAQLDLGVLLLADIGMQGDDAALRRPLFADPDPAAILKLVDARCIGGAAGRSVRSIHCSSRPMGLNRPRAIAPG